MSPRKTLVDLNVTALTEHTQNAQLPVFNPKLTREDIIKRIRIGKFIDAKQTHKLITAAIRNDVLKVAIGIPPGSPRGENPCKDTLNPDYWYEGDDLMELEEFVLKPDTILECSATLAYGDGGSSIESIEEVAHAYKVIQEKYREPTLFLHF